MRTGARRGAVASGRWRRRDALCNPLKQRRHVAARLSGCLNVEHAIAARRQPGGARASGRPQQSHAMPGFGAASCHPVRASRHAAHHATPKCLAQRPPWGGRTAHLSASAAAASLGTTRSSGGRSVLFPTSTISGRAGAFRCSSATQCCARANDFSLHGMAGGWRKQWEGAGSSGKQQTPRQVHVPLPPGAEVQQAQRRPPQQPGHAAAASGRTWSHQTQ